MKSFPERYGIQVWMALLLLVGALHPAPAPARSIVPAGDATVWQYLDEGREPDAAWRGNDFDDSKWKSGKAPLGDGRKALGTEVGGGLDSDSKPITTWFRHAFEPPDLKPGERLVIAFCVDDGAVIYLNGREIGRANLPDGPLTAKTTAPRALGASDEGFYLRLPLPVSALRTGRNVLAVEVHQCAPKSQDIFFDLELKTMPPEAPTPAIPESARPVVDMYLHQNYVGPGVKIPDGYEDGGHAMKITGEGHPDSGREILLVDRSRDTGLARMIAFARSAELQALPPLARAERLATLIDQETTPPGGMKWVEPACAQLQKEFTNQAVLLGDWIEQSHAGVCRHRGLLFKILGEEAGLKVALVRGRWSRRADSPHAWNEILMEDGRRLHVDVTMKGRQQSFPEVSAPELAGHYLKLDNTPWYKTASGQ